MNGSNGNGNGTNFSKLRFSPRWVWVLLGGVIALLLGADLRMNQVAEVRANAAKAEVGAALEKARLEVGGRQELIERQCARIEDRQKQMEGALEGKLDRLIELVHQTREEMVQLKTRVQELAKR